MEPKITFVDEEDNVIGAGSKQESWETGVLHRVVRIYVLNSTGEMLLAKRGLSLASLPGRWQESAAGHVDEGEEYFEAAVRETEEELGISKSQLEEVSKFKSYDTDEPGKKKNRYNMVYVLHYDGNFDPDDREVAELKWMIPSEINTWIERAPDDFTQGFILGFRELIKKETISV